MAKKQMKENNIMLIPAFNEGNYKRNRFEHLRRTIHLVKEAGFTGRIVVVNDGSTDNTAEIAKEEGAELINFRKRRGKAKAVFFGLKRVLSLNPTSVITMDADMLRIEKDDIKRMLQVANTATKERRIVQGIASTSEVSTREIINEKSGIRCFSRRALEEITKAKKSFVREYQLEDFLNKLFKHHTERIRQTRLQAYIPLRSAVSRRYQKRETVRLPKNVRVKPIPRHR